MTDNTERNMIRVLIGMTILVVGLWAINGCGAESNGFVGQPAPCDTCLHAGDAGVDAK